MRTGRLFTMTIFTMPLLALSCLLVSAAALAAGADGPSGPEVANTVAPSEPKAADAAGPSGPEAQATRALVEQAAQALRTEGEGIFAAFRQENGPWYQGDRYVFVWDLEGNRFVYPPDQEHEKQNLLELQDIGGRPIGRLFVGIAATEPGAGWVHYQWNRPHDRTPLWKSTYVLRAQAPSGKVYLIGSGFYGGAREVADGGPLGVSAGAQDDSVMPDAGFRRLLETSWYDIHQLFQRMDQRLQAAARQLARTGLTGPAATAVLAELCHQNRHVYDCATIDPAGIIVAIAPTEYAHFIGADISGQEQIRRLHASRKPVVSQAIDTVEGFEGFDFEHPVFDQGGDFIGSVSLLTVPGFFGRVIAPLIQDRDLEMWVMQVDGRILYDANPEEIGRNLFSDPLYAPYPSLLAAGREMVARPEGATSYQFLDQQMAKGIEKRLLWKTISLYGTEFRLAIAYPAP